MCPKFYGHFHEGISKNRFFASFAQPLRPLRLKQFGFNRKVRNGLRKVRKVQIGCVSASVKVQKLIFRGSPLSLDLFHNPETPPVTGENFPVFCQKWEKPSCLMCILKVMEHVYLRHGVVVGRL